MDELLGTKGTDGTFSDIYLNYLVGQILIGGSRKRGTSLCPHLSSPSLPSLDESSQIVN
jgi:hypothetical protein